MERKNAGSTRSGLEAGGVQSILTFLRGEDAISTIEYGMLAGLVSLAAIVGMGLLGTAVNAMFTDIAAAV